MNRIILAAEYAGSWYRDYPIRIAMYMDCNDFPSASSVPDGTNPSLTAPLLGVTGDTVII